MKDTVSPEEQKVALKAGLTSQDYLTKRQAFCQKMGAAWEQIAVLSAEDIDVINKTMTKPEAFLSSKLEGLAKSVITS